MILSNRPAIAGGPAAKQTPFGKEPRYGEDELKELREALEQQTLFYAHGAKVRAFENAFAADVGARHAVAASSGTAAIHAALMAIGISPGDEVIVPPITDMGSIHPILWQGAVPVFGDVHLTRHTLTAEAVQHVATKRTRAVLAVHLWGNPCDLDGLREICETRGLALIEDCAQAHGASFRGRRVGTVGVTGCYSFNEYKHLSCGDGGVVVTNDEGIARRVRLATDKGYDRSAGAAGMRDVDRLAANYRMTELQGAVALAQLRKLPSIVSRRQSWCGRLSEKLAGLSGLILPEPGPESAPSWWFYMLRIDPERLGNAERFADALKAEGIPAQAGYIGKCPYEYPLFTTRRAFERGEHAFESHDYRAGLCHNAEEILRTGVVLPINEAYTDADLNETVEAVQKVAAWAAEFPSF